MKQAIISLSLFLVANIASAGVLVLTKGGSLPKNATPNGLEGMRESLVQIDDGDTWLNTSKGDIHEQHIAWRDKANRFTIGWDLENEKVVRVYYYKGAPKWQRGKMTPVKWPDNGSIMIDLKSGELVESKNSHDAPTGH